MTDKHPQIVDTNTLAAMAGYSSKSHKCIERWLDKHKIRYIPGKNGPTTTVDLINAANGLTALPEADPAIIL